MKLDFTPFVSKDWENHPKAEHYGRVAHPTKDWEVILTEDGFEAAFVNPNDDGDDAHYTAECEWITLEGLLLLLRNINWKDEMEACQGLVTIGMELINE